MNKALTLTVVAVFGLLGACAAPQQRVQFGPTLASAVTVVGPEVKTPLLQCRKREQFNVRVVEVPAAGINNACYRFGGTDDPKRTTRGCARFDESTQTLTVLVTPPEYLEDVLAFAHIGHEFWHGRCVENFHR